MPLRSGLNSENNLIFFKFLIVAMSIVVNATVYILEDINNML